MPRTTDEEIDKLVGLRIDQLRRAKGLSRQQLANKVNVTHQQIAKYCRAENRVSAGRLAMIARALGKPVHYFFDEMPEEEQDYHQRLCMELSRNFMRIKNVEHQIIVNNLAKSLITNN